MHRVPGGDDQHGEAQDRAGEGERIQLLLCHERLRRRVVVELGLDLAEAADRAGRLPAVLALGDRRALRRRFDLAAAHRRKLRHLIPKTNVLLGPSLSMAVVRTTVIKHSR